MLKEEEQEAERETERQRGVGQTTKEPMRDRPSLLHSAVARPERAPLNTEARLYAYYNLPFVRPQRIPTVVPACSFGSWCPKWRWWRLCLFGFLATDSLEKKSSLSVVILALRRRTAILVRNQELPHWLRLKGKQQVKAVVLEEDKDMHDLLTNDEKMQLQEMMVDVLRRVLESRTPAHPRPFPSHPPFSFSRCYAHSQLHRHSDGL